MSPQVQTIQAHDQSHDQAETEYWRRKGGPPAEIREKEIPDHERERYAQQEQKQFDDVHLNRSTRRPHRTLKHLLRSGEPQAAMGQVECDDVLAHEWLTEVAIHNHIGDYDRAVDGNARSDLVP